ncbi:hypothetical protein K1719_022247 [Acacia pycnantha]|nr:hypothetical protein K1719_022247 [Acacia pycnantha]
MAANRLFFAGLRRCHFLSDPQSPWRPLASRGVAFDVELTQKDNLKKRILGLKSSDPSPMSMLQNWVDQGNNVSTSELRSISKTLFSSKRYHHALERIIIDKRNNQPTLGEKN